MRNALRFAGPFFLVAVIAVAFWSARFLFEYGRVNEQWETSNGAFKIRVQNYRTIPFFKSSYYVFQSAADRSDSWREVAAYPYDGFEITIPMPSDQVRFVGSDIGYFSLGSIFAVTTDRGLKWTIWRPGDWRSSELSRDASFQPWWIEDVIINSDGSGSVKLWVDYDSVRERKVYRKASTRDSGRQWTIE